jgi:hypothetical protein
MMERTQDVSSSSSSMLNMCGRSCCDFSARRLPLGAWRRKPPRLSLSHRNQEAIVVLSIWERMNQGNSLRMACAQIVTMWSFPGQSFEAACKELERLYRAYK